jgi:hypothetical protein
MNPLVSTVVQPEALSFAVALSVMLLLSPSDSVVPAKAGTHNHRCLSLDQIAAPAFAKTQPCGYGSRLAQELGRDDGLSSIAELL